MKRGACSGALVMACALMGTSAARAQAGRGTGDWMTAGGDAQRSSWIRADGKLSTAALQKAGLELLWKLKLDSGTKESFAAPVLLNSYIGYRGFRSFAFVGLSSNKVVGIDSDLGRIEWERQLPGSAASGKCAGTVVALTRPTTADFPSSGGRGGGRGAAAKSAVGDPDEGSVILKQVAAQQAMLQARAGRGAAAPRGGVQRTALVLEVVSGDGMLHTLLVSNGESYKPAIRFLPPNTPARGLIVLDDVVYAAGAADCAENADTLVANDLKSNEAALWKPESGAIAGLAGAAVGPDGTVYVTTTAGELVALEQKNLKVKSTYNAGQPFLSSPVIFEYKQKALIAAATRTEGIHLLDTASLDRPISKSEPLKSGPGSLSTWRDSGGETWLLGTGSGAITAWKVAEVNESTVLQEGWTSKDIASPVAPVIVNGVVFTASTGSAPAVLYALDATTGKELWNSGKTITGTIRGGGISVGNGQVYLATSDGTFYAFGFRMEH
jgi:outer membrane protein assembly factor BamB